MLTPIEINIDFSRERAARLLAGKLLNYRNSQAIVVGVPKGGIPIAQGISRILNLPLELMLGKKIQHPGIRGESIGSVSTDEIVINERTRRIPQDYVYHQIRVIKNELLNQRRFFCGDHKSLSLENKVVILVDDFVASGDTLVVCLKSIRKQNPEKIIVALALSSRAGMSQIVPHSDEIIVLDIMDDPFAFEEAKQNFPPVTADDVKDLFINAQSGNLELTHR